MSYSDNFKLFQGAKSFGAWKKEAEKRGINLNPTLNDIATKFWGDRNYGFGKSSSPKDPMSYVPPDEMIEMISREGSGSGFPLRFSENVSQTINPLPTLQPQPQENSPSSTQLEKLTSEDVNTGIALSTINGMQNQPSQSDSYALIRRLSDQYQNADPMTQTLMDAIYSYQNDYANATTDEARQLAHAGAERAREIARINELDLGLMSNGENLSPEQSNLAMVNAYLNQLGEAQKKFQSVQDNLANNYSESSNDHFWRLYDEYRQQGDSDRIAAIKAGRETTGYQQERVQSLQSAIDDYGIEGGVMNQFGVSLLGQLADEDNIMGSAYANAYATPLQSYKDNQELIKMAIQHQYNLDSYDTQAALNDKNALNAWVRNQVGADNQLERDKDRIGYTKDIDAKNAATAAAREQQDKMDFEDYKAFLKKYYSDKELADEVKRIQTIYGLSEREAYKKIYDNKYKDPNGKAKADVLQNRQILGDYLTENNRLIENALRAGNSARALELIQSVKDSLTDKDDKWHDKLRGHLGYDGIDTLEKRLELYEKVANGTMTLEELQAALLKPRSGSDLSQVNNDKNANEQAKEIGKQAAEKQRQVQTQQTQETSKNSSTAQPRVPVEIKRDQNGNIRASVPYSTPPPSPADWVIEWLKKHGDAVTGNTQNHFVPRDR